MPSGFKTYYVYLLNNKNHTVIYAGVTNDIVWRVREQKLNEGFTARCNVYKLDYFEEYRYINDAIAREKQIKAGSRQNKLELINQQNPDWRDLYDDLVYCLLYIAMVWVPGITSAQGLPSLRGRSSWQSVHLLLVTNRLPRRFTPRNNGILLFIMP